MKWLIKLVTLEYLGYSQCLGNIGVSVPVLKLLLGEAAVDWPYLGQSTPWSCCFGGLEYHPWFLQEILVDLSRGQKHKRWKTFNLFKHSCKGKSVLFGTTEGVDFEPLLRLSVLLISNSFWVVEHGTCLSSVRKPKKPFLVLKLACMSMARARALQRLF